MFADLLFFGKFIGIILLALAVVVVVTCTVSSGRYNHRREREEFLDEVWSWHELDKEE